MTATAEMGDPQEVEPAGVTTAPSGYVRIGNEETPVRCNLPGALVVTELRVWPPRDRGRCHGIGVINFHGLSINGKTEVGNELFGDGCFDRSVLARIEIGTVSGGVITLKTCYEDVPAGALTCTERDIGAPAPANNRLERQRHE